MRRALRRPFTLIQGPPGTGKTEVCVFELARALIRGTVGVRHDCAPLCREWNSEYKEENEDQTVEGAHVCAVEHRHRCAVPEGHANRQRQGVTSVRVECGTDGLEFCALVHSTCPTDFDQPPSLFPQFWPEHNPASDYMLDYSMHTLLTGKAKPQPNMAWAFDLLVEKMNR